MLSLRRPLIAMILLMACDDPVKTDAVEECDDPVAEAGADVSVALGEIVSLDAQASTWCESRLDDVVLTWSFVSVPTGSLVTDSVLSDNLSNTALAPEFMPDVVGEYVLSLNISDGQVSSNQDFTVVTSYAGDPPPTADCGGSYSGMIGEVITLDGTASADPDGQPLTYDWSLVGPECSALNSTNIFNEAGPRPSFVPDCDGLYVVSLVVSDGGQWSEPVVCSADVASENRIPVADAGQPISLGSCADNPINLVGGGSYDLDGDDLTYEWSLVSYLPPPLDTAESADTGIPNLSSGLSSTTDANPTFTWSQFGTYTFQLQVHDGQEWSAPDLVVVSVGVGENEENIRPIANAGDNLDVGASGDCQNTSYSWDCAPCPPLDVQLDGSGSFDPNGDSLQYQWSESTGLLDFSSPTSAVTFMQIPEQVSEYQVESNLQFTVSLEVSDCERTDDDTVTVYYTCEGN